MPDLDFAKASRQQKLAIFLVVIGPEAAANVLKQFDEPEIELLCREGNGGALRLYRRLGFVIEGRFHRRVRLKDGTVEDDLAMAKRL